MLYRGGGGARDKKVPEKEFEFVSDNASSDDGDREPSDLGFLFSNFILACSHFLLVASSCGSPSEAVGGSAS